MRSWNISDISENKGERPLTLLLSTKRPLTLFLSHPDVLALLWTASNELMSPSLSLLQAGERQSTSPANLTHMWALLQKFIGQKTDENTWRRAPVTDLCFLQVVSFIESQWATKTSVLKRRLVKITPPINDHKENLGKGDTGSPDSAKPLRDSIWSTLACFFWQAHNTAFLLL